MNHTLKTFLTSAAVCAALGAGASSAQAEPLFHSSTDTTNITLEADGTSKTGHQVVDAGANGALTCTAVHLIGQLTGKTSSSVEVGGSYSGCTFVGLKAYFNMNSCTFTLSSTGTFTIGGTNCTEIEFGVVGLCEVKIGPQSSLHEVTYHNVDAHTVTAEAHVGGIHGFATGAGCPSPGTFANGNYTTGNMLITSASEISVG